MLNLERKFAAMGARVKVRERDGNGNVRLNVLNDKQGEYFDLLVNGEPEIQVLDVQPQDRHLLLMVKNENVKSKWLMGHDERHWFVAAIPEKASVGTVRQAKEALKPKEILSRQVGLNAKKQNKRRNEAYIRQGEWFFIPEKLEPNKDLILKNEPITRGRGSKPHMCEYMYRTRGQAVMVCNRYPSGVTMETYNKLMKDNVDAKKWGWRQMMRDATVYVKGKITHADHKTIVLHNWHRVLMNTENESQAMRHVAFLD